MKLTNEEILEFIEKNPLNKPMYYTINEAKLTLNRSFSTRFEGNKSFRLAVIRKDYSIDEDTEIYEKQIPVLDVDAKADWGYIEYVYYWINEVKADAYIIDENSIVLGEDTWDGLIEMEMPYNDDYFLDYTTALEKLKEKINDGKTI